MIGITILSPAMVAHRTGCADIAKAIKARGAYHGSANDQSTNDYTGENVIAAITAVDDDLASWFGEEAYQDNQTAWTLATCELAPCMKPMLKGITFGEKGRPEFTGKASAPVIGQTFNKCNCGCGQSPKGKRSRYLPGHDAKHLSSLRALQSLGISRKMVWID